MQRKGVFRVFFWFALLLLACSLGGLGCGGVKHLHPRTGRNFQMVFKRQRAATVESEQMQAETAEFAVENLRKSSKITDSDKGPALQLIPLRR